MAAEDIKVNLEKEGDKNYLEPRYVTEYDEILKNASGWNGLILWARKARGPYLDSNSYTFQVPKNSEDYYTGIEDQKQIQEKVKQERHDYYNRPPETDDSEDEDSDRKKTALSTSMGVATRRGRPPKQFSYY
ncbi:hypothetical protein CONCODRAFT_76842 [Conidiobolus coronatus NRRL 28638]|uniref:Uncharacterized protein n=1 Tax=Conidiobolus coronatus (strain ATCC 28846 / CBS 209.66 / NRRL 28638) TaxID=796925 RepID=A0A137PHG5_CONC2|nr:hypothetical protein CONCODRAFT_76842 [Conidiobolus coronatus NRRL 28638]|eukprot:KXN74443.1 hypothetical protein CONCODRAFT_76842 [Conidiobolus coronatus NRRL 28638]